MGFSSCSSFTRRATASAEMPILAARSAWAFGSCGTNSCSGGSSRRIVTGRPCMARKMPVKSPRWSGRIFSRAFWRPATSLARIISRMASMRLDSKNMCSVRVRPTPSAPKSNAVLVSFTVSAFARTPRRLCCWHQRMMVSKSPLMLGSTSGTLPSNTRPRVPSMEIQSPSLKVLPPIVAVLPLITRSLQPATHVLPIPRATTAA
mmetsp:Transcript_5280/g.16764  ORF Transcript_5280/g.16764 Transcript_5280/m.16764 type:complete len:205 (-) Transcript_5280:1501-2115(-)